MSDLRITFGASIVISLSCCGMIVSLASCDTATAGAAMIIAAAVLIFVKIVIDILRYCFIDSVPQNYA